MTRQATTKGKKPTNLVQTIERMAIILEILGHYPNGLSLGGLSDKVELPKGTTHRLLTSMAYFDFVRQDHAASIAIWDLSWWNSATISSATLIFAKNPARILLV